MPNIPAMATECDYVLGTHDAEVARLGLQHDVWRPRVLDAFARAGIHTGQTVIDVGAGPGFVTADLAELVGPRGRVVSVERSRRFLDLLEGRHLSGVSACEGDLDHMLSLPARDADAAWCRWVLSFVRDPAGLIRKMCAALRPGGALVIHEYGHYGTWRLMPVVPSFEAFVSGVMQSWRAEGGDPDVALNVPGWLESAGARVVSVRPYLDVAMPGDPFWRWPAAFVETGLDRLVALGQLSADRAHTIRQDFSAHASSHGARMMTPLVLEVIAHRR